MQLMITDTLAQEILRLGKGNTRLIEAMADDWLCRLELESLAAYLLDRHTARSLLITRLRENPEETLRGLLRISRSRSARSRAAVGGPLRSSVTGRQRRTRLSPQQVDALKTAVVAYLERNPWANRKQIRAAAEIPTPSLYNRVVGELRDSGTIVAKGDKALRRYALARRTRPRAAAGRKRQRR